MAANGDRVTRRGSKDYIEGRARLDLVQKKKKKKKKT
jgi:hypothetical protein